MTRLPKTNLNLAHCIGLVVAGVAGVVFDLDDLLAAAVVNADRLPTGGVIATIAIAFMLGTIAALGIPVTLTRFCKMYRCDI